MIFGIRKVGHYQALYVEMARVHFIESYNLKIISGKKAKLLKKNPKQQQNPTKWV